MSVHLSILHQYEYRINLSLTGTHTICNQSPDIKHLLRLPSLTHGHNTSLLGTCGPTRVLPTSQKRGWGAGKLVNSRNVLIPRVRKRKNVSLNNEDSELDVSKEVVEMSNGRSSIPGIQNIFIKTWGCAHNSSDSEYMAGQLASYGYKIVDDKIMAHLWLLNSCTVKNPAEDHLRNEIEAGRKIGKKVVVAGCVSQGAPKSKFLDGLSIIGVQQIDRVIEVVEETLKGNSVKLLGPKKLGGQKQGGASLLLPKIRKNPLVEIISISTGCLNQCSYCKTKHARGELGSYPIDEIVERAKQSFNEGVCELWLTSEDTGAYGRDLGLTLPDLLRSLVKVIPDGCKLRLGMTNPPYILDHLEEIAEILRHPRVYAFLHIPVQSGSDGVLAEMKREYTISDFCKVVDTLKEKVPGVTIVTDIICGYPTESEEDFQDTLNICKRYKFPSLFINQFYPRPGTPAAKLERLPTKEVKRRTRELSEFFQSYHPYLHKLGEIQTVLITEESHDGNYLVGHNSFYEQVLVPKKESYLGKMVEVTITETGKHFMKGTPRETSAPVQPGLRAPFPRGITSGVKEGNKRTKQERYLLMSFIFLITVLTLKLLWIFFIFQGRVTL